MVLRKLTRLVSGTAFFILMSVLFSCEELVIIDCTECISEEPKEAYLRIMIDGNNQGVVLKIYTGKLEDNALYENIVSFSRDVVLQKVPLNKYYTVTAEYSISGNKYIVVNSVMPRVKYTEDQCSDPCYYIYDKKVDLQLKNH